jgi:hypothetical protein
MEEHMDIFGRFEEYEESLDYDNDVIQLSEFAIFSKKDSYVYVTDEFGTMRQLTMSTAGRLMNVLVNTEQVDVVTDMLDFMIEIDSNIPTC